MPEALAHACRNRDRHSGCVRTSGSVYCSGKLAGPGTRTRTAYGICRFSVERVALAETESSGREVVYQNAAGPHVTLAVDQGGTTFHRKGGLTWIKRDHFV